MNALSVTIEALSPVAREVLMLLLLMTECAMAYSFIRLLRNRSGWRVLLLTVILFMPPYLLYQGMVFFEYTYPEFRRSYADMMKHLAGSVPVAAAYVWLALCAGFIGWTIYKERVASRECLADANRKDDATTDGMLYAEKRLRETEQEAAPGQMHAYSQAVDQMVLSREILNAKRAIHADMGRVLLMTKHYLAKDGELLERAALIDEWRGVVRFLQTGVHTEALPDVKRQLLDAAEAAGVTLTFRTEPPTEEDALRNYVKDASAKIVEAVREGRDAVEI